MRTSFTFMKAAPRGAAVSAPGSALEGPPGERAGPLAERARETGGRLPAHHLKGSPAYSDTGKSADSSWISSAR